jgi:signal transduction histidine kinase/ActR/RegA family two-component response regulator
MIEPHAPMDDHTETWQHRIRALYANVEELYSHVDITVAMFDRNLVEVGPSPDHPASPFARSLAEIARRTLETGEPQRDIPLDEIGRQRVHAFPLRDQSTTVGVVCVVDDDGARRELFVRCAMAIFEGYRAKEAALLESERTSREEAQRANRMRDEFLAVVSHELRSPIASILLWEQVLRGPDVDAATLASALDAIHESAASQALLIDDLLDVSRAINGKLHIDRGVTSIASVLTMTVDTARPRATVRKIEIKSQIDPELGSVLGDSRRLRQVFDNLLSNAIKCTDQGVISVQARQTDDTILIDVSDTGRGIAPEFLPHLFEPFSQAERRGASEGLGLGLGIARQLVELHGGTLSASSEGLGHGATFTVSLPRVVAVGKNVQTTPQSIKGVRVLLVDDDVRILEALKYLLQRAGAVVATASSAAAAYLILEEGEADVLVSDIGMPGEDGYSLMRRIRATQGAMQSVPAIALTALLTLDSPERAFSAGFDQFLMKPIDVDLVILQIAALVRAA